MAVSRGRRRLDIIILVVVIVAGFVIYKNAVTVGDWWHSVRYVPPPAVEKLADDAGMSADGRSLFYRFNPQFVDKQEISTFCGGEKLGCAVGRSIYILESSDAREYNRSIVTAAHEMLHIAYDRLSDDKIQKLKSLYQTQLMTEFDIKKQIEGLNEDNYYNEAHSYIGTESSNVSEELESYYMQYFDNRSKTTSAFKLSPES